MIRTLSPGTNVAMTRERPNLTAVDLSVAWTTNGDPAIREALTVCAFACEPDGKVACDEALIFFNQPISPDGSVALTATTPTRATFNVSLSHATFPRLVVAVYVSEGVGARRTLGQLGRLTVSALDASNGQQIIATQDALPHVRQHGAALLAEVYRHGQDWKFKAVTDGFSDGMTALMTAMGVRA